MMMMATMLPKLGISSRLAIGTLFLVLENTVVYSNPNNRKDVKDDDCDVYLAPSTIPGAGWGVFAGRDFVQHDVILQGDIVVPVQELSWNNGYYLYDEDSPPNLWSEYHWNSDDFEGMGLEGLTVSGASTGVGALPNCLFSLINLDSTEVRFDRAGIPRSDPGAGAFTPYHDRQGVAKKPIEAGMELFINYGVSYFADRTKSSGFPVVPRPIDFKYGRKIFARLIGMLQTLGDETSGREFWKTIFFFRSTVPGKEHLHTKADTSNITLVNELLTLVHGVANDWYSRSLATLPYNAQQIPAMVNKGITSRDYDRSIRSLDDLKTNGFCIDRLRAGPSTLPHAGRGAFSRRTIPQGTVVAPVPLLHIPNRDIYNMHDGRLNGESYVSNRDDEPRHKQLLLNYCFGHEESSLLLCNYGSVASLINHSQQHANVRLQWNITATRNPEWLEMPLSEWTMEMHAGLVMELVATRDISADEEIFLDYGQSWQSAWLKHLSNWKAPPESDWYRPADELNEDADLILRTRTEGGYGGLLTTYCREHYRRVQHLTPDRKADIHECEVVKRRWSPTEGYRYTVELVDRRNHGKGRSAICMSDSYEVLWDVPRDAIVFDDAMYARDHLQSWSFRQHIGIPDELFPNAWRDRRTNKNFDL